MLTDIVNAIAQAANWYWVFVPGVLTVFCFVTFLIIEQSCKNGAIPALLFRFSLLGGMVTLLALLLVLVV